MKKRILPFLGRLVRKAGKRKQIEAERKKRKQEKKSNKKRKNNSASFKVNLIHPVDFKEKIDSSAYSFAEHESWVYSDNVEGKIRNRLAPHFSKKNHLVLRDSNGRPRFTLQFSPDVKSVIVYSVQRERTQYTKSGEVFSWVPELEKKASAEFKSRLGMHPAEFLLSEFIYRNRNSIRQMISEGRNSVYFDSFQVSRSPELYKPLIERFFEPEQVYVKTVSKPGFYFRLNLSKKRVQELLGIKLEKIQGK